jgi:FemAB-related protein (PEP-CTERM system-associated)
LLQLAHLKSRLFGNSLISIPYFDFGGLLAKSEAAEKALVSEAVNLAERLTASQIELRHTEPVAWLESASGHSPIFQKRNGWVSFSKKHKVRMLLDLPDSSETLMKSFPAKLRSQIKKPTKEGLKAKIGGRELLDDFYHVFLINMRDLGSPVHSREMMGAVLEEFPEDARMVIVYKDGQPLACSLMVGFKDTMENPWASALKDYSRLSPNMLLYWTMIEYACDNGFRYFDFGRSSPDEGTYRFKQQWGAKPVQLHWQFVALNGHPIETEKAEASKFEMAVRCWQKLPVSVTRVIGPRIRKYIGL